MDVTDADLTFGGNIKTLLPAFEQIPQEFKGASSNNKWNRFIADWFYSGLTHLEVKAKNDIDTKKALRHIGAVLGSFEPKHEHKMAGCAYLASCFFEDVKYQVKK